VLWSIVGVKVVVAPCRNKLALRRKQTLIVFEITSFTQTNGQTDMARSTSTSDPDQEHIYLKGSKTLPVT